MRALTQREQRTVRLGSIGLGAYLILYCSLGVWGFIAKKHKDYQQLLGETRSLRQKVILYQSRVQHTKKLMEGFHMDPAKLTNGTVLAQASAAIQRAAMGDGVAVGAVRESPARPSSKELGSIQLEAAGPAPALLKFVQRTHSLGYPLVIDTIQISSEPSRPGQVKLSLTFVILDFDQWKLEKTHA